MEQLSPANQALIAKMQNNQVQIQAQTAKAPELPNDTVELSTSVKKPKNKAAMIIGGLIAGAAVAASLIVAYKKGVFFKLEGAIFKKEADKAYQKAQVVVDEVTEFFEKGKANGFEDFTDDKTGRLIHFENLRENIYSIREYGKSNTLVRSSICEECENMLLPIRISENSKKGTKVAEFTQFGLLKSIRHAKGDKNCTKLFEYDLNGKTQKVFKKPTFNTENGIMDKGKFYAFDENGKLISHFKMTDKTETSWLKGNDGKSHFEKKAKNPKEDLEIPVEEDFAEEDFVEVVIADEEPINIDDIIITASEGDFAE